MVAYNEHKINFSHKLTCNGTPQMFNRRECKVRSVAGHNAHEKEDGRTQEGGTSMLLFGPLIQHHNFEASGNVELISGVKIHYNGVVLNL